MSDMKSKLPDLKELTDMTTKLFKDVKKSVTEIAHAYQEKRKEGEQANTDTPSETTDVEQKVAPEQKTAPEVKAEPEAKVEQEVQAAPEAEVPEAEVTTEAPSETPIDAPEEEKPEQKEPPKEQ